MWAFVCERQKALWPSGYELESWNSKKDEKTMWPMPFRCFSLIFPSFFHIRQQLQSTCIHLLYLAVRIWSSVCWQFKLWKGAHNNLPNTQKHKHTPATHTHTSALFFWMTYCSCTLSVCVCVFSSPATSAAVFLWCLLSNTYKHMYFFPCMQT